MIFYNAISKDSTGTGRLYNYKNINKSCLSTLIDDIPLGIVIADKNGFIKRANSTWIKMFGYTLCNNAIPNFLDYRYKHDRNRDSVLLKSLFDREIEHYNIERKYIRKDGSELWCNTSARLIENFDASNLHVIGAYIDITEYKNTVK